MPEGKTDRKDEIFIDSDKLGTALNGDEVLVQNERVVRVVKRAKTEFAGTIKIDHEQSWLKPYNTKIYNNIAIIPTTDQKISDGDRVVVSITNWQNLAGKIVKNLGPAGLHKTEMETILFEHDIDQNFNEQVLREAERIANEKIAENEVRRRKDFRSTITFTIDPDDAKDFDDAISYKKLPDGNIEIGVHIADVSYFVRPGGALDREALRRATSVYLVDRTIPMLPETLSNGVCSLLPNIDRLTFAAVFVLDKNGRVLKNWFGKTIIHSNRRFTYEEVDKILETSRGDFVIELKETNRLAKKLREERFVRGSVSLETEDIKFRLDADGKPVEIIKHPTTDSHRLIEEFMLLANRKVAESIFYKDSHNKKPGAHTFVYRIHDKPDKEKINNLKKFLKSFNYKFEVMGDLNSKKLNDLIMQADAKPEERLIKSTILRSMAKAIYTTKNIGHFGLAFTCYTHFTSPIRRYPDIIAHRLLENYIQNGKSPDMGQYEKICLHSSQMERQAMEAEWDSIKYKQVEYNLDKVGQIYIGVITGVTEWGMFVEIKETMAEGLVSLRNMKDDYYTLDEKNFTLIGKRTKKKYRLGDEVKVKLVEANLDRRTLDFVLV